MKKILFIILGFSFVVEAQQDPHFSIWQATPSILNPAATAAKNEDFTFFVNNRQQWLTATPHPFMTSSFSGEARIGKESLASGWFGSGLQVTHDLVGRTGTSSIYAGVPISYTMETSQNSRFSMGFKPGIINRQMNTSFQTWDNQWNGVAFDQTTITGEPSARKMNEFDLGAGVFYQYEAYNSSEFNIGFTMNHITRPNVTFREIINELYPQYVIHTGARIHLEKVKFKLSPQITAFKQGPINYLMVGTNFDIMLSEGSRRTIFVPEKYLTIGVHYRNTSWATLNFGMKLEALEFGLAYDAPIGSSRAVTGVVGAAEIFVKYAFVKGQKRFKLR